ncbi:serine carboxypeptidase-like 51 [Brachypodium distachyon]|uniref:Carboxypeptidase n=1 Tax=Brachypodium distachyon TaxID=15368 RepID=I1I9I9_BRADI|nr:serine carboxypeptidase-like 51 [Brachypodium distachyon]KQJ99393.1 hypothetical protein BRADI_3g43020v3 [Brachypodium distachyon]|eukprot:XP_003572508.1 serine carboxypeptidase-like 51 [Brachypodium distachyon]
MAAPGRLLLLSCIAALLLLVLAPNGAAAAGTADGSEEWGYVQVRPKAHMFWWLYRSPHRVDNASTPWPTVLWLQGGPGASGVGYGNFEEIGPLDVALKPRNSTWLNKADLLFVDNPVGTGFSFVEAGNTTLLAHSDAQTATDLTALLVKLYGGGSGAPLKQGSPLYIVAESYGGKFAVTTALAALKAIGQGQLKATLAGVALGDSWISPEDFVLSWGPLLYQMSRLDENGLQNCDKIAQKIKAQLKANQYTEAEASWEELENAISALTNAIDFYNILKDSSSSDSSAAAPLTASKRQAWLRRKSTRPGRYLRSLMAAEEGGLQGLMDTRIKAKLGIIPANFTWGQQDDAVFDALKPDFMKPRIHEVDELLKLGVNVTIYTGQLDLICATKGTLDWVQKLKWEGLKNFTAAPRKPIYCNGAEAAGTEGTQAFLKSYKNLNFYWIMGAGHMVPVDNPCTALKMLGDITQSPAK